VKFYKIILLTLITVLTCVQLLVAQSPTRVGTTAGNFLELGYDPKGIAMGDAVVSSVNDLSSVYWNPSGLANMTGNEVYFTYQDWLVDTYTFFAGAGFVAPDLGTFAISVLGINYGEMEVTTLELQEGTGENFTPTDLAVNLSYGRKLTPWFGFGATVKYIHSSIYHLSANAFAIDLGVNISTSFLAPSGTNADGMKIGMALLNYGTRMQYEGLDLMRSVDISPDEAGNYKDVKVNFQTDSWELPLVFRVGVSLTPIVQTNHKLTLTADALHANNNNESLNLGGEYAFNFPGTAKIFLRGGYRGVFLESSEFGPTFGIGFQLQIAKQNGLQFDYAYRDIGILGYSNILGFSFLF
jgi:hypothetical protein